jgi:hypothetical protein
LRHPHSRPSPSSSSAQHGHEEEALSQEDLAVASELEASGRSRGRAGLERRAGGWGQAPSLRRCRYAVVLVLSCLVQGDQPSPSHAYGLVAEPQVKAATGTLQWRDP